MTDTTRGKKLAVLLSTPPHGRDLGTVVALAEAALTQGVEVYLYLLDDGVMNLNHTAVEGLAARGAKLFCCAYAAQKRNIPRSDRAVFGGLFVLRNLITSCDQFVAFN